LHSQATFPHPPDNYPFPNGHFQRKEFSAKCQHSLHELKLVGNSLKCRYSSHASCLNLSTCSLFQHMLILCTLCKCKQTQLLYLWPSDLQKKPVCAHGQAILDWTKLLVPLLKFLELIPWHWWPYIVQGNFKIWVSQLPHLFQSYKKWTYHL